MSDNKLRKIMADLFYEANTLSAARIVIKILNDYDDLIKQYVEYSVFFAVVRDTCMQSLFLSTTKIFDESKYNETSSLKYLKMALPQESEIDKDKAKEIIATIKEFLCDDDIKRTLNTIKEIRNQFIAHKQIEVELKARDMTMDDIYGFIDETFKLLNQVADRIGFPGYQRITKGNTVEESIESVLYTLFPVGNSGYKIS